MLHVKPLVPFDVVSSAPPCRLSPMDASFDPTAAQTGTTLMRSHELHDLRRVVLLSRLAEGAVAALVDKRPIFSRSLTFRVLPLEVYTGSMTSLHTLGGRCQRARFMRDRRSFQLLLSLSSNRSLSTRPPASSAIRLSRRQSLDDGRLDRAMLLVSVCD